MRLLIITQAVDHNDRVLGFFVGWIAALAGHFASVTVIALRVGEYSLPSNVTVYALKKHPDTSRFEAGIHFLTLVWRLRDTYDSVFVHMNQEYILLAGWLWRLLRKKIFLWRNHFHGDMGTSIAVSFSTAVFCTSTASFTAHFDKTHIMPAGIDVAMFRKAQHAAPEHSASHKPGSLLVFGRIAPVKQIERAIELAAELTCEGHDHPLTIVGDALPQDSGYLAALKDRCEALDAPVTFLPGEPFANTPHIYAQYDILLNFTPSGSFDKTVIEALASGMKVLVANTSMKDMLPEGSYLVGSVEDMARQVRHLATLDAVAEARYMEAARTLVEAQSLDTLVEKLVAVISHA